MYIFQCSHLTFAFNPPLTHWSGFFSSESLPMIFTPPGNYRRVEMFKSISLLVGFVFVGIEFCICMDVIVLRWFLLCRAIIGQWECSKVRKMMKKFEFKRLKAQPLHRIMNGGEYQLVNHFTQFTNFVSSAFFCPHR